MILIGKKTLLLMAEQDYLIFCIRLGPVRTLSHSVALPQETFHKFIFSNIVEEVLHCTNLKGRRVAAQINKTWRVVDRDELLAFIV